MKRFVFSLTAVLFAVPAFAGEPADIVRGYYERPDDATNVENKGLTEPLLSILKSNIAAKEEPCIDFSPVLDAQDWDAQEVKDSLTLAESVNGGAATVTATFKVFGEGRAIAWSLVKQPDGWKVSDIASADGSWTLSKFECK